MKLNSSVQFNINDFTSGQMLDSKTTKKLIDNNFDGFLKVYEVYYRNDRDDFSGVMLLYKDDKPYSRINARFYINGFGISKEEFSKKYEYKRVYLEGAVSYRYRDTGAEEMSDEDIGAVDIYADNLISSIDYEEKHHEI